MSASHTVRSHHLPRCSQARRLLLGLLPLTALLLLASGPLSRSPVPAAAGQPLNVVQILMDDASPADIAHMTYTQSLPGWTRFEQNYGHISLCCPARVDLLSGRYSDRSGVEDVTGADSGGRFDDTTALPVAMQRAGYYTILAGKYLNEYGSTFSIGRQPPGWNRFLAFKGEPAYYNYTMLDQGVTPMAYGGSSRAKTNYSTNVIRNRFTADLQAAPAGQPVYAVAAPYATHGPWDTTGTMYSNRYAAAPVPRSPAFNEADVSDKPAYIRAQPLLSESTLAAKQRKAWAAADAVDDLVRQTVETLQATGRWDHTVLMLLSDNGYSWGDHRWQFKKCPYTSCMRVPLMVRYPGSAGRTVTGLSSQVDVATTIAAIGGATPLVPQDGISLLPTLRYGAATGRTHIVERYSGGGATSYKNPEGFAAYRTADWLYVRLASGERELYDERADPFELANLAGQPPYAATQAQLDTDLTKASAGEPPVLSSRQGFAGSDDD